MEAFGRGRTAAAGGAAAALRRLPGVLLVGLAALPLPAAPQQRGLRAVEAVDAAGASPATAAPCEGGRTAAPLSLQDVLALALCASPQREAARALVRAQQAQVAIERSGARPQAEARVAAAAGEERSDTGSAGERGRRGTRLWAWALQWELYDAGRRDAVVLGARHLVDAALDSRDAVVQGVLLAAGTSYFQLLQAEGVALQRRQSLAATRQLLAQALQGRGDSTLDRLGELQARTEIARGELGRAHADADVERARAELAGQLGWPPTAPLQLQPESAVVPPPDEPAPDAPVDVLIAEAMQQHPELRAARARVASQAAAVEASRLADRPSLSLQLDQGRSRDRFGQRPASLSIGLALTVPLIDGGQRSALRSQAGAELGGRRAELQALERDVAQAVWVARQALQTQRRSIELAQQMQAAARDLLEAETQAFLAGESDMFDVLDARSSLDEASIELLTARAGLQLARLQLAAALGQLR